MIDDDFIGTQAPVRRILDPDEAIATLEGAVPGLVGHRRPEPVRFDWSVIEDGLGVILPADFKCLAERYPAFALDNFLRVSLPDPGREIHRFRAMRNDRDWWDSDDAADLRHPYPAPGGLLPWGESYEGDRFLWSSIEHSPQQWQVTVASRNGGWWHYEGGVVQFLAELCDGTLEPWALPPVSTKVTES
ncbi:SMI1/KNR4 family protein [Streptomyces sp. ISL-66]|uniref:SMI1/KNR4 family protein n=1 Tax=Streptomyces sp. ISL-66 TaxID=2819186 RepID=UPI001BE755CA|nr:SMI1/KNR4 family protein [Streptomyces sp. ISL-66]MBT2469553.1 SMI1/KNR4 family protein [Streptomyces sp. ISL-66]